MSRMGGGGRRGGAFKNTDSVAKDLKTSLKRLFKELKPYKIVFNIAIVLSIFSAIIAIVTPNRLSDLTDEIGKGLIMDTAVVETISQKIMANQDMSDIEINSQTISFEEQMIFLKTLEEIKDVTDRQIIFEKLKDVPESIQKAVEPKMNLQKIKLIALTLITLYILSGLFAYIQSILMTKLSNNFAKKLRESVSLKINKLALNYYDKNSSGDILSRVTNDIDNIGQAISSSTTSLISSFIMIIGAMIMMFYTNWILAISAILSSVFGFVFMFLTMSKSQKYFVAKQEELGNLNGHIEEIYSSLNVVKVYNGEKDAIGKFENYNEKVCDSNIKSQFLSNLMHPMMMFVGNFAYVVVCVVGAVLAASGHISFGVIVAFVMYVRLFHNPMAQIAQGMTFMQSIAASSERVFELLDEEELSDQKEISKKLLKNKIKGEVVFDDVSFRYQDNKKDTIKNFSAIAKPGQKIAIVGPTGAGKTTIVNLLMKFYEINSGDIKIDGISINDLTRENIRDLFTMVLQDTWLFDGTVRENIVYNNKGITDDEINKICESIGLDHFIKTLPKSYDSVLSENESVSSGQKQLITIARGIIKDSPLLILDEATSSVDARTEELVQKAMDKLSEGKTSFIIAHRLSTIKNANLILVMKDGNIIEQGTHDELMNEEGFYFDLYNSQFVL